MERALLLVDFGLINIIPRVRTPYIYLRRSVVLRRA